MEDIYQKILRFLYQNSSDPNYKCIKHIFLENNPPFTPLQIRNVMYELKDIGYIFTDVSQYNRLGATRGGTPIQPLEEITIPAKITADGIKHYRDTYLTENKSINVNNPMGIVAITETGNQSFDLSDNGSINSLTQITTNKNPDNPHKKRSLLQIIYWIIGIIVGLIAIYEFLKNFHVI